MHNETLTETVKSMVAEILAADPAYFLVEIRVKPIQNLKIFLDGDLGITIEKCVQVNRALYKKIEETGLFPAGDFSLEVSSAGLDEPLKSFRQYKKNMGRPVEIILQDGSRKEGKLKEVNEEGVVLEESSGKASPGKAVAKKQELSNHIYLFNNIKSTKVQVVF
ncbi:MAG: ribosome maturation factor [Bacteroidota bacterium]|nr:ribosome maturation factor [Bacteroidota bacterium]MDP4212511.1 ribosome maturation factor [Bacteroidota bacterium]MDP4248920.1 ribosome maturation factor [Bacteroidota bacterium]